MTDQQQYRLEVEIRGEGRKVFDSADVTDDEDSGDPGATDEED